MQKETDEIDKIMKGTKKSVDSLLKTCSDYLGTLPSIVEVKRKSVTVDKKKATAILMQDGSVKIQFEKQETGNKYFESLK